MIWREIKRMWRLWLYLGILLSSALVVGEINHRAILAALKPVEG